MPPKAIKQKDKGKLKLIPQNEPQPSTSDRDSQVQFEVELLWCIQQLQSALSSGKLNQKQIQDNSKTLNSLMSNSTPIIRKRQLMRLSFGDYRAKMTEEEAKLLKKNEKIVYTPCKPSSKSMFVKKAPFLTSGKNFKFNFAAEQESKNVNNLETALQTLHIDHNKLEGNLNEPPTKKFQFEPSNNVFRFNFSV